MAASPAVAQAIVLLREDLPGGKGLVAYYLLNDDCALADPREYLAAKLPEHMVPSHFVRLEHVPLTPGGKVNRRALPRPELTTASSDDTAPTTGTESLIAQAWCEVLGRDKIGVRANFFESGGHSMLAIELHGKLQTVLNRRFPMVRLFEHPTIAAFASWLAEGETPDETTTETVERAASRRRAQQRRRRRRA